MRDQFGYKLDIGDFITVWRDKHGTILEINKDPNGQHFVLATCENKGGKMSAIRPNITLVRKYFVVVKTREE